jgi:hypothetical protein
MAVLLHAHPRPVQTKTKTTTTGATADLRRALGAAAGVLAAASGLIHLAVIRDHLEFPLIASGFAVMAVVQWAFALRMLTRPSSRVLWWGGVFHVVLVALWALSRTTGLWVIPGAEAAEDVGIADLVSTTFCLGVIGIVSIARALERTGEVRVPRSVARRVRVSVAIGALFLTVPALSVPHEHDAHGGDSHATSGDHGAAPVVTIAGHGHSTTATHP